MGTCREYFSTLNPFKNSPNDTHLKSKHLVMMISCDYFFLILLDIYRIIVHSELIALYVFLPLQFHISPFNAHDMLLFSAPKGS